MLLLDCCCRRPVPMREMLNGLSGPKSLNKNVLLHCSSKYGELCLNGLMPQWTVISADSAVLFLLQTNHLHEGRVCVCVCIPEGGFSWFKHSWCLNWVRLQLILCVKNHLKAHHHGLTVFMSWDTHTRLRPLQLVLLGHCVDFSSFELNFTSKFNRKYLDH